MEVDRALRASGYPELRNVRVIVQDGIVHLNGSVSRYYLKQIAQSAARSVVVQHGVKNELFVA